MKIGELRATYRAEALERGINPRDFDLLLADVLRKPVTWLIAHDRDEVDDTTAAAFDAAAVRRFHREPLQYIRGHCEFFGREFSVDERVLIPRPETEFVVEAALNRITGASRVIDIGTGSGCIAVSVAAEAPQAIVFATDRAMASLAVAKENSRRNSTRVRFAGADLFAGIAGTFDLILSNPPYVPLPDAKTLQEEVRAFEPHLALFGGEDGLDVVRRLILEADARLAPGGAMILEIGYSQSEAVADLGRRAGFEVEIIDDLAAIPRVVVLSRHTT